MCNPASPTKHGVGSVEKVDLLAARYAAGLPLFVAGDSLVCDVPADGRSGAYLPVGHVPQGSPRDVRAYSLRLPFYRGASD